MKSQRALKIVAAARKVKATKRRKSAKMAVLTVTSTAVRPELPPDAPHMIGYARVSMSDQNNQRQIDDMVRFGVDPNDIYADTASGRDMNRPGWQAAWRDLREGDLLVVHAIDRLGRDLLEVCQTLRDLHAKGAALKVLSMDIDTRTVVGQFIFSIMAAFAEMERKLILERTMHGLAKARERGVVGGSAPKHPPEKILKAAEEHGVNQAGPKLGMSKGGFIKALKRAREWQREQEVFRNGKRD